METRPKPSRGAIIAAAILAIGVLGLFIRLQEYGPESALRKFHQAITRRSLKDLQKVTAERVDSPEVQEFVGQIASIMRFGGNRFRILRTDRTPTQVRAAVAYPLPNGQSYYRVWVIDRKGQVWKVNVEGTLRVY